jgi:ABC-type antimicrobial peptide transport system permease subunit
MSYLAMSAEPINNENNQSYSTDNSINRKKQHHNKTQKYRQSSADFNPQKVNSVLETIHNRKPDDDDDLGNYSTNKHSDDFKSLNPLNLFSSEKKEAMTPMNSGDAPQPTDNEDLKLQELQSAYMNDAQVRDYYRKLTPSYQHTPTSTPTSTPTRTSTSYNNSNYLGDSNSNSNQVLIEKLNYMINLLEEQQDQKTESVTEEVVLYSFLGIFIIFIVDSFTKVGKYVR